MSSNIITSLAMYEFDSSDVMRAVQQAANEMGLDLRIKPCDAEACVAAVLQSLREYYPWYRRHGVLYSPVIGEALRRLEPAATRCIKQIILRLALAARSTHARSILSNLAGYLAEHITTCNGASYTSVRDHLLDRMYCELDSGNLPKFLPDVFTMLTVMLLEEYDLAATRPAGFDSIFGEQGSAPPVPPAISISDPAPETTSSGLTPEYGRHLLQSPVWLTERERDELCEWHAGSRIRLQPAGLLLDALAMLKRLHELPGGRYPFAIGYALSALDFLFIYYHTFQDADRSEYPSDPDRLRHFEKMVGIYMQYDHIHLDGEVVDVDHHKWDTLERHKARIKESLQDHLNGSLALLMIRSRRRNQTPDFADWHDAVERGVLSRGRNMPGYVFRDDVIRLLLDAPSREVMIREFRDANLVDPDEIDDALIRAFKQPIRRALSQEELAIVAMHQELLDPPLQTWLNRFR